MEDPETWRLLEADADGEGRGQEPAPAARGLLVTSTHLPPKGGPWRIPKESLAWRRNVEDKIKETSSLTETRDEKQLRRHLITHRNEPSLSLL